MLLHSDHGELETYLPYESFLLLWNFMEFEAANIYGMR